MMSERRFVAPPNQAHLVPGCRNSPSGLLLERVENVDPVGEPNRVDYPVRVPLVIFRDLKNAGSLDDALQGLRPGAFFPSCARKRAKPLDR